jgi:hypothetical protein
LLLNARDHPHQGADPFAANSQGESLSTKVYVWRLATFANPQGLLLGDWDYASWRRDQLEGFLSMTREYAAQLERDETR